MSTSPDERSAVPVPYSPAAPDPDDKDWTWVLQRPCPDCGFRATGIGRETITERLLATTPRWLEVLARDAAPVRPAPQIWSPLEYGCHVRDVHTLFGQRARSIVEQEDPEFANWDQDETALSSRYWEAEPAQVAVELEKACTATASVFSGRTDEQWERRGRRSNGSVFTLETLGVYYLHDVVHHLHDVDG